MLIALVILLFIALAFTMLLLFRMKRRYAAAAYHSRLIEATSEAVYSVTPEFIIQTWNKGAEKLYGYTAAEAIGQPTFSIVRSRMEESQRMIIRQQILYTGAWEGELEHLTKDGSIIYVLASATASRNEKGEIEGYVSVALNISDRKKLELQLQQANFEMEAFTYSVSHDLRAPLRRITGFVNILQEEYATQLDEEAKRIATVIQKNSHSMTKLVDDLLEFFKTGQQELDKSFINTSAMVSSVIEELPASATIKWNIPLLPEMLADKITIRQVWINLLSNAIKYSSGKEMPAIEVGSYEKDKATVFFVKDNGAGFDSAYAAKLFQVFQRLHSAKDFEGTGIGLALVKKIITRHGGEVWAEGKLNEGACFYFSLPQL